LAKLRQIFMTAGDMARWFAAVEEKLGWKIKFVPYGPFDAPQPEFANCLDIPNFGVSASGDERHKRHYFIVPATANVVQEPFRLNNGQMRCTVNPQANSGMVGFDPSGVCAPTHVVTGEFDTALTHEGSVTLDKALSQVLRKQCTISGTAAVGAEALELHRAGYRLNDRLAAHPASDLVIRGLGKRAAAPGRGTRGGSKRRTNG